MDRSDSFTSHARDRSTARAIPPGIAEMILEFGVSRDAGDGARKHGFSRESLREIRHTYGREVAKVMEKYRAAYVVAAAGRIITVAFARRPLFH